MERYLKVPVKFAQGKTWFIDREVPCIVAALAYECGKRHPYLQTGTGSTEEEAFNDLKAKLGYEEVKP